MYRLFFHFISINCFVAFLILIYSFVLLILSKKLLKKNSKTICKFLYFVPLLISIIHFATYFLHLAVKENFRIFGFMYIFSILFSLFPFLFQNKKIPSLGKKFYKITLVILGIICYLITFYNTIMVENIHNLTYDNYTSSFKKTLKILEKEYVLNDHKKINYDYLYNKYYPKIEQAEVNSDEQLYFKTMYEFAKEFKDGHFEFYIYYTTLEETTQKYAFTSQYQNRNYGFASILLSNNEVGAILVDKDSEAYNLGLRDGMTITKKNNQDIKKLLNEIITPISAYPVYEDEVLLNSFYLFATGEDTIEISFIDENNEEKTIKVKSISDENEKPDILLEKIMYYNTEVENLETKMINNNTGYIYIEHEMYAPLKGAIGYLFDDASYLTKVIDQKISELINDGMKNLIIDLRGNTGGYGIESAAIASMFTTDNYIIFKESKGNSQLYDYSRLKGNGKYSNINVSVIVNADTASAGDLLVEMLSKCKNTTIFGFTNSNNSAQSIGGLIYLPGGKSYIQYPIYRTYNEDGSIKIDTNETRNANVAVDVRLKLTKENIQDIIYKDEDYLLNYVLENLNK